MYKITLFSFLFLFFAKSKVLEFIICSDYKTSSH